MGVVGFFSGQEESEAIAAMEKIQEKAMSRVKEYFEKKKG